MLKRITGTKDILPDEVWQWQKLEDISRTLFARYNYREIRPPLIEELSLFNRSLGESTEIVQKQMFVITKGEDSYALRPEATASVVRAYIENNLDATEGLSKLYYFGPMFRLERPQKGRQRQFHHIGCEVIGSYDPAVDVEVISLSDNLLKDFSISGYQIELNSLGCSKDRKGLSQTIKDYLQKNSSKLCAECKTRLQSNVLRILDCKNEQCKALMLKMQLGTNHLCSDCLNHFNKVKKGLDDCGITYNVNPCLVRGLDYYTRTVFEIKHSSLGAQDALGAGGRYDNLVKELGGPDAGAAGVAFGVERLLLAVDMKEQEAGQPLTYVISLGENAKEEAVKVLHTLRQSGIKSDTDYQGKSLKGAMRKANDLKARYVVIIGEDEINRGSVTLKDMASGDQKEIKKEYLITSLQVR